MNTRPRVAVVGCGTWGRNHVRNYAELGALAAVVDADPATAARLAGVHGVPALAFEAALGDPSIDGLVFALPPSQNLPLGRMALAAGKHLFVEKPLALSVEDGAELVRLAEAHHRQLMVGHILRYHPAFVALADLVREGRLGTLLSVTSTRLDLGRVRREEDALWALAPHDLSMLLALAGSAPSRVEATGGYHTHPTIADRVTVELAFPGGLRGEVRVSWLSPFKEQRLVVVGSDAMAVFDDRRPWDQKLLVGSYRLIGDASVTIERADDIPVELPVAEPLREECRHFLAAVETGVPPLTDGAEGVAVLDVLERASLSLSKPVQDATLRLDSPRLQPAAMRTGGAR